jgi:hypothetical protein
MKVIRLGLGSLILACIGALGCAQTPPAGEAEPAPPASEGESTGAATTPPTDAPPEDAAVAGEPADASSGRLAFVTCESPRKSVCTREYRPVCAEVDTGIRCIKAPCPSSEKKQYGNGCSACADEKVIGYFPAACDQMTSGGTP